MNDLPLEGFTVLDLTKHVRGAYCTKLLADYGVGWEMEAPVYRFAHRPTSIVRNAPRFGEHNEYVFGELLGLSSAEMAELEQTGVTGGVPNMAAHR